MEIRGQVQGDDEQLFPAPATPPLVTSVPRCQGLLLSKRVPPPDPYVEVLSPRTLECDLIWEQSHCRAG